MSERGLDRPCLETEALGIGLSLSAILSLFMSAWKYYTIRGLAIVATLLLFGSLAPGWLWGVGD